MWIAFGALLLKCGLVLVPEVIYNQRRHENAQGWTSEMPHWGGPGPVLMLTTRT